MKMRGSQNSAMTTPRCHGARPGVRALTMIAVIAFTFAGCNKNQPHSALSDHGSSTQHADESREHGDSASSEETIRANAQATMRQKLNGYWLLDADASLKEMPPERQSALRKVFQKIDTGMIFTAAGRVTMNVAGGGDLDTRSTDFHVVHVDDHGMKIEFVLSDTALTGNDVHAYATIEFIDTNAMKYKAFMVREGEVLSSDHAVVMRRVSVEQYREALR